MNVLVGSSRARDLAKDYSIKTNPAIETWFVPGGKYTNMIDLVDNHTLLNHGGVPESQNQSHFYVIAGLCDVSRKESNFRQHYKEVIFTENVNTCVERVKHEISTLHQYILDQNHLPIFATIMPSHLERLNFYWLDNNITTKLDYSNQYSIMQDGLLEAIKEINSFIPSLNSSIGLSTPCLHKQVYHNKSKG